MRLYCFISLILLLSGCSLFEKDSGPTLVEGRVVDSQTGQPVGNVTVQVERSGRGGGFGGGGFAATGPSYPTDATGHFSFRFEADDKTTYIVRASSALGHFTDWTTAPKLQAGRKNQGVVVPVLAPAWVRLQLVDELPKSRVTMYVSGYSGPGDQINFPRDTTYVRSGLAEYTKVIYWVIRDENGNPTEYSQNINPAALDTVTVRIPF